MVGKTKAIEETVEREVKSGALARGLAILHEIVSSPQPLALGEIASLTKLDQSTALRLLRTLETAGYVLRLEETKRYAPTPQAIYPLPLLHPLAQVRREVQPLLEQLSQSFGLTAVLILYINFRRMVVDIAQSAYTLSPYYLSWIEGPLHATASGKALLAGFDIGERRRALGSEPYTAETACTLTEFDAVNAQIEECMAQGFATARDEQLMGLTAIAANIPIRDGRFVGCLGITGLSRDIDDERIGLIGPELVAAAKLMPFQISSLNNAAYFLGRN